ncbi:MAG: hypothetical protein Q9M30_05285 [Mariprofundaceae bacterium]|nr:hypothetical protein [Mariprofundaceae bacterium]
MKSLSLKKRIIFPLLAVGVIVFLIGGFFVQHLEEHQKENTVLLEAESLQNHLRSALDSKAEVMAASLRFIALSKQLVAAMKAEDRQRLLASQPQFMSA